jgi:hypothetical protein
VAADKIHCNKPLDKWQLSVLKHCLNKTREVAVALSTVETTILGELAMVFATVRANNVLLFSNTPT